MRRIFWAVLSVVTAFGAFVYYTNFYNLTERGNGPITLPEQFNCSMCEDQQYQNNNVNTSGIIIYRDQMNVRLLGIEKLHPFDTEKYGRVFAYLKETIPHLPYVRPKAVSYEQLAQIHTDKYLYEIQTNPKKIAKVAELELLSMVPNIILQRTFTLPMRYAVGATIAAGELIAPNKGYKAVFVLGGGFHHAYSSTGGGWCFFSDVILSIIHLSKIKTRKIRVLYIDLDAHTGNGVARDKRIIENRKFADVYIIDMYNAYIYPSDREAERSIDQRVQLTPRTSDKKYLRKLDQALASSIKLFPNPDIMYFNAGSDVLKGDPLGGLSITPNGLIKRDEMVFQHAKNINCPIVMVLSGGYQKTNARVIANSIISLNNKFTLF